MREHLARLLTSSSLRGSPRLRDLLRFLVEETLAGRGDRLKGYTVATEALGREADFDPRVDPQVSIQAARLRRALDRHYRGEGTTDEVRIEIPKGGFVPVFSNAPSAADHAHEDGASGAEPAEPFAPAVAVLPFADLDAVSERSYFAEGLAEEISLALTRFEGLRVVSWLSTVRYPPGAVDVREVGRELGVSYVLAGTTRRDGNGLKVTATLSDAASAVVAWSDRYEFDLTVANLFDVQDRITQSVVARIASNDGVINRALTARWRGRPTEDLGAYDAVQVMNHFITHVTSENFALAVEALERATQRDPGYGLAWGLLGSQYANGYALGFGIGVKDPLDHALVLARRAVALDPECQRVHWCLAHVLFHRREVEECLVEIERAIELNPNNATLLGQAGWGMALCGRWERGREIVDQSIRLNPFHPSWFFLTHFLDCYRRGEYAEALTYAVRIALAQMFWDPLLRAAALGKLGLLEEAGEQGRRLLTLVPDFRARGRELIRCYVFVDGLDEQIIAGLRAAGLEVD